MHSSSNHINQEINLSHGDGNNIDRQLYVIEEEEMDNKDLEEMIRYWEQVKE